MNWILRAVILRVIFHSWINLWIWINLARLGLRASSSGTLGVPGCGGGPGFGSYIRREPHASGGCCSARGGGSGLDTSSLSPAAGTSSLSFGSIFPPIIARVYVFAFQAFSVSA